MPEVFPIDVILYCPKCGKKHIDKPNPKIGWTNPPHRSHECQFCKTIWRAADVPTNGVAKVETRGEKDTYPDITKRRDCCPVCGFQFEEVHDIDNRCPRHQPSESFTRDQLITEDDDYAYVL